MEFMPWLNTADWYDLLDNGEDEIEVIEKMMKLQEEEEGD